MAMKIHLQGLYWTMLPSLVLERLVKLDDDSLNASLPDRLIRRSLNRNLESGWQTLSSSQVEQPGFQDDALRMRIIPAPTTDD